MQKLLASFKLIKPGVNCPGVNCPGVNCPGVNCPGVNRLGVYCPGVNCPPPDYNATAISLISAAIKLARAITSKTFINVELKFSTADIVIFINVILMLY